MFRVSPRGAARLAIKAAALAMAFVAAYMLRFDGMIPPERIGQVVVMTPIVVVVTVVALHVAGVGRQSWQYTTLRDVLEIAVALAGVSALLLVCRLVLGASGLSGIGVLGLPLGVIGGNYALSLGAIVALRAARRLQAEAREAREVAGTDRPTSRVLLIGAGRAGVLMARELHRRPDLGMVPVAFLDDDPAKLGRRVAGLDVVGTVDDVGTVGRSHRIDRAVITIAAVSRRQISRIVDRCEQAGVPTKIVPGVYEIVSGKVEVSRIRDVDVADLLGRHQVELDPGPTADLVARRSVLVTGAGGSIGSELVRQVAHLRPSRLVLVEQSEPALWAIHREIMATHPDVVVREVIADVCDEGRMARVFSSLAPDVVVHAAAHKHVPMMEANPGEAVKNNVGGTKVVADLALAHDVERFVLVSTDKAVNPTSVMGASKRLAERYVQHLADTAGLPVVAVRFGNVLGSMGSVVPVFKEQVARGGPVTVTHPDVTRYFMTIPEAAGLVLHAAAISRGGEVMVLDMGEPVRIVDLAEAVIRLSGMEPHTDIEIAFTGLRPGEKLFEELSLDEEQATRTDHPKVWIGAVPRHHWPSVEPDLARLFGVADTNGAATIRHLRDLVPEFVTPDEQAGRSVDSARSPARAIGTGRVSAGNGQGPLVRPSRHLDRALRH